MQNANMPKMVSHTPIKRTAKAGGKKRARKKPGHTPGKHRDGSELVIITGMSGSGKASALKAFEDLGYYCVDNLPVELIPRFAEIALQSGEIPRTALVVDVREGLQLEKLPAILKSVKRLIPTRVILSRSERCRVAAALQRDAAAASTGHGHDGARIARRPSGGICGRSARLPTWSSTPPNSMFMNCGRT